MTTMATLPPTGIRRIRVGATGHRYEINRQKAIGVTTALGLAIAKPGLMRWAARCVAEEATEIIQQGCHLLGIGEDHIPTSAELINHLASAAERRRNAAAVRGTKIHSFAEKMVHGEAVDVPEELAPYVDNCARFMDEWRVAPMLKETIVGSYQWGYAGTFDLVGALPDGRRILWDYKTGRRVYAETKLQLAAYRHADAYLAGPGLEVPMAEVGITDSKAVWLRDDGYDVIPLESGPAEFKTFLHCLQVAKAVRAMEGWEGEPERCPT
jgi:hypothetical protein